MQFFVVYIREAHPSDGWVVRQNERQGISVPEPRNIDERQAVATKACSILQINIPCLVDDMNDSTNQAYDAWPDRLYIVDINGRVAAKGERGPRGFSPSVEYAREWLKNYALTTRSRQ